jgi:two-component system, OmpR family, response regulator
MPGDTGEVGHILVVDDDAAVRQTITNYLEKHNVPVASVSCRQDLNLHLEKAHPSLILLDLRLGKEDGLDVLKEIRSHSDVPITIMTGHSREEVDRVVGLELGADDYLVKPFSLRELLARVRSILRRHERGRAKQARGPERGGYRFNGWSLERRTRGLVNPDGAPVSLTTKSEYALLLAFLKAPQRPLTREMLLQATRATRTFSTEASMSKSRACDASSRSTRMRHV